jgi:hypothetical protein
VFLELYDIRLNEALESPPILYDILYQIPDFHVYGRLKIDFIVENINFSKKK